MLTRITTTLSLFACFGSACAEESAPRHHTADGFQNLYVEKSYKKSFIRFIRMRYFSDEVFSDHEQDAHRMPVDDNAVERMSITGDEAHITWLGHSTFLVQYRGFAVLTDPILSDRASPVFFAGPERLVDKPITISDIPKIDFVIISHNHYDHLDQFTIELLGNEPTYLVPLGVKEWFEDLGIDGSRVIEFDWWDERSFDGIRIVATPSQHWSGRGLYDRYQTLWASWRIDIEDFSMWFGGDTGYNEIQFKQIYEKHGGVDLALIPIGAYEPRWFMKASHVNPEEAINIHNDIGARISIGMHWGTFQLSAEPFFAPRETLQLHINEGELRRGKFITLKIGESIEVATD